MFNFRVQILLVCSFLVSSLAIAKDFTGELYSENTYVPEFGVITDSQIRMVYTKSELIQPYLGFAHQNQFKTQDSQTKLFDRDFNMGIMGLRLKLHPLLTLIGEYRNESRSRFGLYSGHIWLTQLKSSLIFAEYYAESFVLPDFDNKPITTLWGKLGLRYQITSQLLLDPYLELNYRNSPNRNLGRNIEQFRIGIRSFYFLKNPSGIYLGALLYQSFPKNETPHEEALLVVGGQF